MTGWSSRAGDIPIAGTTLRIKDNLKHANRRSATFRSADHGIDVAGITPTTTGANLELVNPGATRPQSAVFALPASGWKQHGRRTVSYTYDDKTLAHGPVGRVTIRNGKLLAFAARGATMSFALGGHPQGSIGVVVTAGATRYCALFGGKVKRDTGVLFVAANAPAPATCPTTPSTTTTTTIGTGSSTTSTTSTPASTTTTSTVAIGASVLQYHDHATRDGVYVDAAITASTAAAMHMDAGFHAVTDGRAYAQPLFVDGMGGADRLFVFTEKNWVYSLDPTTGSEIWKTQLAAPVALSQLGCGNIDPAGITGTPVIDYASHTLYVDTFATQDAGTTVHHLVWALGITDADHAVRTGYPIDVTTALTGLGQSFDPTIQGQRGALALFGDTLYVPFGGLFGNCGQYHGWVLGVPTATPANVAVWSTVAKGGGVWGPSGVAADDGALYVGTGNTFSAGSTWSGGEAVIRLHPGPTFSGTDTDFFAPTNWSTLDSGDVDLGGSGVMVFDLPGATPSQLLVALGKDGKAYLVDRSTIGMGGVSVPVASHSVSSNSIINGPAVYRTDTATYVVFKGQGSGCPAASGNLVALSIGAATPPTITTAWCASFDGSGSPMVTTSDGHHDAIVWTVGAEGDNKLRGFDGDSGAVVFGGGGLSDVMSSGISRFATPIAAKGRIYVAGTNAVYAFMPQS